MLTLIDFVVLIWSFFPSAIIYRMFVVHKGGKDRDPDTGRIRSKLSILSINLGAAIVSMIFIYPMMTKLINDLCSKNPFNALILLVLSLILYYKILKP